MIRSIIIILFFSQLVNLCKPEPNLENGEILYQSKCSSCHFSEENNLFSKDWKNQKSLTSISNIISKGIKGTEMQGFNNQLTENEIFDLSSFLIKNLNDSLDFDAANKEERKEIYFTEKQKIRVENIFNGNEFKELEIKVIWSLAFLDSNTILFTERKGQLYKYQINERKITLVKNTPKVFTNHQAGLLEIKIDINFRINKVIYLSYIKQDFLSLNLVVTKYQLLNDTLIELNNIIFIDGLSFNDGNFGSRIEVDTLNHLFISSGDRSRLDECQAVDNGYGKVHKVNNDGTIPNENPFKGENGQLLSTYSYGHRNSQGLALQPKTNNIWAVEHGPMGGDELNLLEKGANYGWPIASYGTNYDGSKITDSTHIKGTKQPKYYWVPSIAPGDVTFYSGKKIPSWQGNIFVTGLRAKTIFRLELNSNNNVIREENILGTFARLRAIEESPDGYLYFSAEIFQDNGQIYRIMPLSPM